MLFKLLFECFHSLEFVNPGSLQIDYLFVDQFIIEVWELLLNPSEIFDVYLENLNVVQSHYCELPIELGLVFYPALDVKLANVGTSNNVNDSKVVPNVHINIAGV